jgi:hypothetical protein
MDKVFRRTFIQKLITDAMAAWEVYYICCIVTAHFCFHVCTIVWPSWCDVSFLRLQIVLELKY